MLLIGGSELDEAGCGCGSSLLAEVDADEEMVGVGAREALGAREDGLLPLFFGVGARVPGGGVGGRRFALFDLPTPALT